MTVTDSYHGARKCSRHEILLLQVDVFTPLCAVVSRVWALWELLVLAEPLMVVAPTPGTLLGHLRTCLCLLLDPTVPPMTSGMARRAGDCSAAVAALISLIAPLPYSADFRPYFTVSVAGPVCKCITTWKPVPCLLLWRTLPTQSNGCGRAKHEIVSIGHGCRSTMRSSLGWPADSSRRTATRCRGCWESRTCTS